MVNALANHKRTVPAYAAPRGERRAPTDTEAVITSELIAEYTPGLLRQARRMLRRPEDAEDAVQETWFSALRSASAFEGRSSLRTWLTRILRRRVFDRYHSERLFEPLLEEPLYEGEHGPEPHDLYRAATQVTAALSGLQDQERTAIVLCDVDDCDRLEAAERMRIKRGHLRVLLHRGRTKLERELALRGMGAEILSA